MTIPSIGDLHHFTFFHQRTDLTIASKILRCLNLSVIFSLKRVNRYFRGDGQ